MNDTELLATVKDSFAEVRADTPLTAIERRGRTVRARRRRGLAGAAAAAVATAVVLVLAQQPGTGTRPGPVPSTHMAAWTVTEKAPGIIEIKIRELKDLAGLQRRLRSDGVPAFVRFQNQDPPGCRNYPLSPARGQQLSRKIFPQPDNAQMADNVAMVIDAAAIPPGVGLWIEFIPPQTQNQSNGTSVVSFGSAYMLVYASGHCPPGS
jgi:hypothetical protein